MSLINRMLQDLDARQATLDGQRLPDHVRPLPRPVPSRGRQGIAIVLSLAAAALVVAFAGYYLDREEAAGVPGVAKAPVPAVTSGAVAIPAAPEVVAQSVPASAKPAASAAVPSPVPLPEVTVPRPVAREPAPPMTPLASKAMPEPLGVPGEAPAYRGPGPAITQPGAIEKKPASAASSPAAPVSGTPGEEAYRSALEAQRSGRAGEAREALQVALLSDPGHVSARLLLAGILAQQGALDEARQVLGEGIARDASNPALAMRLARIQVERGEWAAAAETLRRASSPATGNADFRGFHAAVMQRLDRHREAVAEYRAALALAPAKGAWWAGLGLSLEADGRAGEAREAFGRARRAGGLPPDLDRYVSERLAN